MPSFTGLSYLRYPSPSTRITTTTSLTLTFYPTSHTGLILYIGDVSQSRDFLSLSLINGYIQLRYDLGSGPVIISSNTTLALDQWHTIIASRTGRSGLLSIDSVAGSFSGVSPLTSSLLNAVGDLYVGGVADYNKVSSNAGGSETGFSGCVDVDSIQVNVILNL